MAEVYTLVHLGQPGGVFNSHAQMSGRVVISLDLTLKGSELLLKVGACSSIGSPFLKGPASLWKYSN